MRRILFVYDDENSLEGVKKILRPMRYEWEMEFVMSGEDALNFMSKGPYDVVVSDMRMPEMDGIELLGIVMECYPETVRIIYSENSDREMILKSVDFTHQFLVKPSEPETVKYTIERACKIQDLLRNKVMKSIVGRIKDLPSLPRLYGLIIKEMKSQDVSLKRVGDIISQDVSMSAKILQLVNSAFFGLPCKIIDPQQAAVYLGIETLKALILSIHVFSTFTEDVELCDFSSSDLWKHSLMTGKLAKEIARNEMADEKIAEEALIAGLLHDIGKLIMLKIPEQYREVQNYVEKHGGNIVDAEYAVMKTSHAELGAYLLGLWGLPDNIVETVAFHHNPSKLLENIFIMSNKPSNGFLDKIRPKTFALKPQSVEKYLTGFTTLTAVHMANALLMHKNCSFDTTVFPYADMLYMRTLNLADRIPKWVMSYNKIMREEA